MPGRQFELDRENGALVFRHPRNWTAVVFFAALGLLHWGMAASALLASRWEGHMSVVFGTLFLIISAALALVRHEIVICRGSRTIIVRGGFGRLRFWRPISFDEVSSIRVTLLGRSFDESSVAIVCERADIELPPTNTPRQEGLLLAMTMGVRLVKVYGDGPPPEPAERIARLYRNEDAI